MQFSVTFRHMEATEALKEYARERLEKIRKYFPDPMHCHVVLSAEKHNHRADVNVQLHNGFRIAGHEATENMYSSIDMVSAKIERQVRRYKNKLREHKRRDMTPVPIFHSVVQEQAEAASSAPTEPADAGAQAAGEHEVIKREQFDATPLSVSEAIMQLNLLHEDFHVFRNLETGQVNVVYRRSDGSYGLIESPPAEEGDGRATAR